VDLAQTLYRIEEINRQKRKRQRRHDRERRDMTERYKSYVVDGVYNQETPFGVKTEIRTLRGCLNLYILDDIHKKT